MRASTGLRRKLWSCGLSISLIILSGIVGILFAAVLLGRYCISGFESVVQKGYHTGSSKDLFDIQFSLCSDCVGSNHRTLLNITRKENSRTATLSTMLVRKAREQADRGYIAISYGETSNVPLTVILTISVLR